MDVEIEDRLTINKEYAEKYVKKKQAEELSKLRDKYGDVGVKQLEEGSGSESSSGEEEDEEAEALTPQVERDFLRTLSLIKSKDPRIYNKDVSFFSKDTEAPSSGEKGKEFKKPMYLKDYERKRLLERGSLAEVSDNESEGERGGQFGGVSNSHPTYTEEQEQLKESFKGAVVMMEREEEEGEGGEILTLRKKTKQEQSQEEEDYRAWLSGKEGSQLTEREKREMDALKNFWTDPRLDQEEAFLRDYILNKGYMDKDSIRVPTYEEVVGSEDEGQPDDSEDEDALERQEEFERKYNFRFEEPGGASIESFPRTITGSVRRADDKRKLKRKERLDRKEQEKETKREELKRLKNLKKKEIMEKLNKLASVTGNPVESLGLTLDDIEEDFDPKEYDARMISLFSEEYYAAGEGEEEKPVFSDIEGEDELVDWDPWQPAATAAVVMDGGDDSGPHCDDPDFNMDADYHPEMEDEYTELPKFNRKKKRKSKFAAVVQKPKPTFEPTEKSFEKYLQEYYQLDSLVTGDKFKYRKVMPNNFGLTTDEILHCRDKELNRWVSLSKSVQYRNEEEERRDKKKYRKRARDWKRKRQLLTSLYNPDTDEGQIPISSSSKSKLKDRTAETQTSDSEETFGEGRTIATSKVQDDCEVRENKDTSAIPANDDEETKMASATELERASSSQEMEKMADSTRDSVSKRRKRTTDREGESGERKTKKKRVVERRDGAHKHSSKSARRKHQALLKQKLKLQRKRVSEARLKAYGLKL